MSAPSKRRTRRLEQPLTVTDAFKTFVLDQLDELGEVTPRAMFGGVGLYYRDVFFGIIARDVLYMKVDDTNQRDYERAARGLDVARHEAGDETRSDGQRSAGFQRDVVAGQHRRHTRKLARPLFQFDDKVPHATASILQGACHDRLRWRIHRFGRLEHPARPPGAVRRRSAAGNALDLVARLTRPDEPHAGGQMPASSGTVPRRPIRRPRAQK